MIPYKYFQKEDTLSLSKELLGKVLVSNIEGRLTSGIILETEAYLGRKDKACHAYNGKRTKRTEVMYLPGGHWYVYLCYGMHNLLNLVTHKKEEPHAILIRAIQPLEGIETMLQRRNALKPHPKLTSGPGSVCKALGITVKQTGEKLGKNLWIEDRGILFLEKDLNITPRIGIAYAEEDAFLPYRFSLKG